MADRGILGSILDWRDDLYAPLRERRLRERVDAELEQVRRMRDEQTASQRQAQLDTPSVPLDPTSLISQVAATRAGTGQPLSQAEQGGLLAAASRPEQGGVGMRRPFTETGSLLSYAPTNAPMTDTQFGASVAQARSTTPTGAARQHTAVARTLADWATLDPETASFAAQDPELVRQLVVDRGKTTKPDTSQTKPELAREWAFESDPVKKAKLKEALDALRDEDGSTPTSTATDKLYNSILNIESRIAGAKIRQEFSTGFNLETTPEGGFRLGQGTDPEAAAAFYQEVDRRMRRRIQINPALQPYADIHPDPDQADPNSPTTFDPAQGSPTWRQQEGMPDVGTSRTPATAPTAATRLPLETFSPDAQAAIQKIWNSNLPPEEKDRRIRLIDEAETAAQQGR